MIRTVYTFTIENEDGEKSSHNFFNYAAGWEFARLEQADYYAACGGRLSVVVDWEEREDCNYVVKSNGEITWEE